MFLLDTDTCVRFLRNDLELRKRMTQYPPESIRIPILAIYELRVGIEKSTIRKAEKTRDLAALVGLLDVAPFSDAAAYESARTRAYLEKKGTPIGSIDYLIAGTALADKRTLVTGNTKEFKRVPGLNVETW